MKYRFDWKDIVHGHIEIEADSGVEADRMFCEMTPEQRIRLWAIDADKYTLVRSKIAHHCKVKTIRRELEILVLSEAISDIK